MDECTLTGKHTLTDDEYQSNYPAASFCAETTENARRLNYIEIKKPTIKYCLLSSCALCLTVLFAVVGASLILTQNRFEDFPHHASTVVGIVFLSLAVASILLAAVFRTMFKHHVNQNSNVPTIHYTIE